MLAARVMLLILGLFTMGGSAVFQFVVVIASREHGISASTIAIAFSLNAVVGVPAARYTGARARPGIWLMATGVCAIIVGVVNIAAVFFVAIIFWGFAFWMGVPGVLRMLSARSLEPGERAGDAQAMMAIGRAFGPMLGGGFVDTGAYVTLAAVAGSTIGVAGLTVISVQEGRERLAPTDPRVA